MPGPPVDIEFRCPLTDFVIKIIVELTIAIASYWSRKQHRTLSNYSQRVQRETQDQLGRSPQIEDVATTQLYIMPSEVKSINRISECRLVLGGFRVIHFVGTSTRSIEQHGSFVSSFHIYSLEINQSLSKS